MTAFPIAATPEEALDAARPRAKTMREAEAIVRGPVYLATTPLSPRFESIAAAEAAYGDLYGDARFEVAHMDGAWRVLVRHWRAAPPAPVARTAAAALRKPLGRARTPEEARALLGSPVELATDTLAQAYATPHDVRARYRKLIDAGLARVVERAAVFHLELTFWRPLTTGGGALLPAERAEIAARLAQPLRATGPQASPFVGLFEQLAPENPAIVLAEEGDGRIWE